MIPTEVQSKKHWKRDIIIFLSSQTFSLFGSALVQYAIMWHVTLTTKSGMMMTLFIICGFIPTFLLSPFAGVWADRFNRKYLIIIADAMIAFVTLILAITFLLGYSDMVEDQRRILYAARLRILKGEQPLSPAEQRVRLFYIDELWADHLAYVSYLREGIHLESLASRNPIDEFHAQITEAYEQIPSRINNASENMLERLGGSNDPAEWEKFGLKSPASTRTYIINDQYLQNKRNSWTGTTVFAYWLRMIAKPIFKLSKY